ncbi:YpoC family protein [Falsibacillus albus]|uniref:YpoC-like domain-containing protein n=1 Tax=Falsibacillus albus TaxID=2478915 RepID=A0A3L7JXZ4_9BACI|nr:hypothetical protein [Falsibacillus albus]RLQ95134.1 hypothetical protein D9X91_11585 [Falsibacillus albus]
MNVPAELIHPLFQSAIDRYFPDDANYYRNAAADQPWMEIQLNMPLLMDEWKRLDAILYRLFSERSKEIVDPMKLSISFFLKILYWTNNRPVQLSNWQQELSNLRVIPVNTLERLQFIESNPFLYHSYKQVSELIKEQSKLFAKYSAMKNSNQSTSKDGC